MHVRERSTTKPVTWQRSALRWLPTFFGFPLGGLVAELISGPVDGLVAAVVGGAITGIILGAVQSWGLGRTVRRHASGSSRPAPDSPSGSASAPPRWTTAPASATSSSRARSAGSRSGPRRHSCCAIGSVPSRSRGSRAERAVGTRLGRHHRDRRRRRKPVHGVRFERRVGRHRRDRGPARRSSQPAPRTGARP